MTILTRDTQVKGLEFRTTDIATTARVYVAVKGVKRRCVTIGVMGSIINGTVADLDAMRAYAQDLKAQGAKGQQPRMICNKVETFKDVVDWYAEKHISQIKNKTAPTRHLNVDLAALHDLPIDDIGKRVVLDLLDHIATNQGGTTANRVASTLKTMGGRWLDYSEIATANPFGYIKKVAKEKSRTRFLSKLEAGKVYGATFDMSGNTGAFYRLLMLSAMRISEIAALEWSWVQDDCIEFPAHVMKMERPHTLPLTPEMVEVLETVQGDHPALVFPSANGNVRENFVAIKASVDTLSGVTGWVNHDLRRTFSIHGAREDSLRIRGEVREKILAHEAKNAYLGDVANADHHAAVFGWSAWLAGLDGANLAA